LDSGSQEAELVQDKHSYNENKQTYKGESVTENYEEIIQFKNSNISNAYSRCWIIYTL